MREHRGERERDSSASSYDTRHDVDDRRSTERTPAQAATERVFRLRQATEAAALRARNLPAIVQLEEWRAERASLTETHAALSRELEQHAADATLSKQAQQHHDAVVNELGELETALTSATEPRAIPPVPGEEGIEPRINDRSANADDVLAWVAGLGSRERRALAERLRRVQGSADRGDRFAVELANYLAATRTTSQFLGVIENPRRFNRAAYEKARAATQASGATERGGVTESTPPAIDATSDNTAGAVSELNVPSGRGGPLPYRGEMERSFGRSFGDVDAHTGMAAALAPLGAQALTVGRTVAFADAQPSPALVAHEATHVVQNERAGTAMAMASGVVAPRESAAEAEADASAQLVATHGPGTPLPSIVAAPAAHVHLAPKLLVPDKEASPQRSTLLIPDADHPARRDIDGEQVIQTGEMTGPGKASPLRGKSWTSLAEVAESVQVQDDSGDTLHIDITYRLENRPAEVGEIPDTWIHTERKALLTIGTGEHAGATIVGQARIQLAAGESRDPKMAIAKASIGPSHWAQVYLAESQQYVNLHGSGGRASLRADAADNDVLAYDDPLRTLVGLKNILKQQHVAGHGGDAAKTHARAQRLLAEATSGRAVLEREAASIRSHHDPHPGRVAPVKFLVGDIGEWLATNQRAGRDDTEDARQLRKARAELEHLIADAENAHAPNRDQLDDALSAPGRFVERTAEGVVEVGAMAVDAVVLGVDALGKATGIGTFDYHPLSKFGRSIDASGSDTTTALVTMVNGFADEWSDAVERAKHGDYRGLTDVSIDTLMMIDGARTGGAIALDKVEAVASKIGRVAKSAHALAKGLHGEIRDIAAAMADGADAFAARLHPAAGMQMAGAGAGGGSGPNIGGGLGADALAEAAKAAKEAFQGKRHAQHAAKHGEHAATHTDAAKTAPGETPAADKAAADKAAADKTAADKTAADKAAADKAAAEKRAALDKLEAKGLDKHTAQRFDALSKDSLDKFAALNKQALERFATLDGATLQRFGELPAADLLKFRLVDETGLKRFGALDDVKLKRFASQFEANGLKAFGTMDLANFTEPRTTAAALDQTGGHSYAKHGADTTPAQHETRLKTGVAPDGSSGTPPLESGQFASDDMQVAAAKLADQQLIDDALNAKGTQLKKIVDDIIVTLPGAGVSYSLDAGGTLVAAPANRVLAMYKLQPGPDGMRYVLYTMYPIL